LRLRQSSLLLLLVLLVLLHVLLIHLSLSVTLSLSMLLHQMLTSSQLCCASLLPGLCRGRRRLRWISHLGRSSFELGTLR
jgi:hypothetical protein